MSECNVMCECGHRQEHHIGRAGPCRPDSSAICHCTRLMPAMSRPEVPAADPKAGEREAIADARRKVMRNLAQFTDRDGDTPLTDKYFLAAMDEYVALLRPTTEVPGE